MSKVATCVQGTNDSSILSKYSMISKHYFKDDFVQYFAQRRQQRSPIINRGYYVRAKAVQKMFENFFEYLSKRKLDEGNLQIVSFGAGFDSSYFRLKNSGLYPKNGKYFEVDFYEVLERKLACILKNQTHLKCVKIDEKNVRTGPNTVFLGRDYCMIGVDLGDIELLNLTLKNAGLDFTVPTFLLSECVFSYLNTKNSDSLLHWASEKFTNSMFVMYEQVYPFDGFGCVMMHHFESIGSPLKSLSVYPSLPSQEKRFLSLGWKSCKVQCMNCFFSNLPPEERSRIDKLELFDEYEEFHLKCSHYAIVSAYQGIFTEMDTNLIPSCGTECVESRKQHAVRPKFDWKLNKLNSVRLKRFGHKLVVVDNKKIAIFGGFGEVGGKHQRLTGMNLFDLTLQELPLNFSDEDGKLGSRMHSSGVQVGKGSERIFIFGGRSSPARAWSSVLVKIDLENITCGHIMSPSGQMPLERWRHTAVKFCSDGNEYVVVYGGRSTGNVVLGDCFKLDVSRLAWSSVAERGEVPCPRHSHTALVINDSKMIITGGLDDAANPLQSVYELDFQSWSWKKLPISGLLPRYSHTAHAWRDHLFLFGGVNSIPECLPGIAVIDLKSLYCQEFCLPGQDPSFPVTLHGHCSLLKDEEGIVQVIGGGGNYFSFGTHFNNYSVEIKLQQFVQR